MKIKLKIYQIPKHGNKNKVRCINCFKLSMLILIQHIYNRHPPSTYTRKEEIQDQANQGKDSTLWQSLVGRVKVLLGVKMTIISLETLRKNLQKTILINANTYNKKVFYRAILCLAILLFQQILLLQILFAKYCLTYMS